MKKKRVILLGALSASCICAIALTSVMTSGGSNFLSASNEETWSHYDGVANTFGKRGIKEYWVSCSSHTHQFTKPLVDDKFIEDKGAPSQDFIDDLAADDDRLLQSYVKYIDFEDDAKTYPFFNLGKSTNIKSVTVQSDVGYNGSKCLVIEANDETKDRGLFFTKEYLDDVFADSSVKALEFDAKGDAASSNFRHRTGGSNVCYHQNQNGWGLKTEWTTFSYTREMYEVDATTGAAVIWGTMSGKLYVDNIKAATKDQKADNYSVTKKFVTMDAMGEHTHSGQDWLLKNAFINETDIKLWTTNADGITAIDYPTDIKTEGSRSLHFHKKDGNVLNFGVSTRIINSLDDAGITFEIMASTDIGPANFQKFAAPRSSGNTSGDYTLHANKWTTVTIKKENIRDCSPAYVFSLTGTNGMKEMDVYIDNIRPATPVDSTKVIDFEDNGMFTFDTTYKEFGVNFKSGNVANPTPYSNLRDTGNAKFWINNPNGALGDISINHEKTTDGSGSLKIEVLDPSKSFFFFINKSINTNYIAVGDSIAFDVYNDCLGNISLGAAGTAGRSSGVTCPRRQWTTVSFVKGAEKADQFFRLHEAGAGSTGSFYIDNIRIVKAA